VYPREAETAKPVYGRSRKGGSMSQYGGIHTFVLHPGADPEAFEAFITEEVFPTAADTPGRVNRGGRSSIQSQHLLKVQGNSLEYLWLVKASGVFDMHLFSGVFDRMYGEVQEQLETFGTRRSSTTFTVVGSFDDGPRDVS
jgi:hypothetical protein